MSNNWDSDSCHSTSSESAWDEEEVNIRVCPTWKDFRELLQRRGYYLDTYGDVKKHYERFYAQYGATPPHSVLGYTRACTAAAGDCNALCKDEGLPANLFRGTRRNDGIKFVVKAVHLRSREWDIMHFLNTPGMRSDPMNHCIPVLDMIPGTDHDLGFIVMEEWLPQLINDSPCCLRLFLGAIQQIIDHTVFMHQHRIAHLDLSLRNILTDYKGHYACIDYESSRRYDDFSPTPRVQNLRATETTPEIERGESVCPYKVDVWTLAVLLLRACQLTGYHVPELLRITELMLQEDPHLRPSAHMVQKTFDAMVPTISEDRLRICRANT